MRYLLWVSLAFISGCVGLPEGITPVNNFEISRYMGKWYEVARLDHTFERNLHFVSADYTARDDGGVNVLNRGFNSKKNEWSEAKGKAYFVGDKTSGHLKVSFFGPFYGSYVVFELGDEYDYSFVTSMDRSYLWLLSRKPCLDNSLKGSFIDRIGELDFDVNSLIWVEQDCVF